MSFEEYPYIVILTQFSYTRAQSSLITKTVDRIINHVMNKRLLYVSCFIISCIIILSQCISRKAPADLRGEQFAGAATCAGCHKDIYDNYISTAHYNTSRPASGATVKGSFLSPENVFIYGDSTRVVMEDRDSGLYQTTSQESHRFDIAIGSGTKAQTYLYWQNDQYFQLPVSYFVSAHSWANSPGFPANHPKFDRMIPSTCFGCHSSMVGIKSTEIVGRHIAEKFEKNQVIYGIDCERCHGPAASHVEYHTEHPSEKTAMHMTKIGSLKNQQKLDMCALCHSGLKTPQKSTFDFRPGDALSAYIFPDITRPAKPKEMDVHGTQYQLFTASKCFIKSRDMNCSSCHDPHTKNINLSLRCMSCHSTVKHSFAMPAISENCVDCHMPALPSNTITLLTKGQISPTPDLIRTHLITIYPEETKKVLLNQSASLFKKGVNSKK